MLSSILENISLSADDIRNFQIFYPYALGKTLEALTSGHSFVHYCSSTAAASMIQHQQVWMRNATWMNDSSEIAHGKACLAGALESDAAAELATVLDGCFTGLTDHLLEVLNSWIPHFEQETYITCLTEQLPDEEQMGRLSMWRAYGAGSNPVAFVVNSGPFLRPSDALDAYTSPVAYLSPAQFIERYTQVAKNIVDNIEYLQERGRDHVFAHLFAAYRHAIICTKHPSFHEEREWRIIYQPTFQQSKRLLPDRVTIAGSPQRIFKIPMIDVPEDGFYGATLPDLFQRLLIGPSNTAAQSKREFIQLLHENGVPDAALKVEVSDVPLRV
ncbi:MULTISPECIES: DUF2971 domain-containing protein [Rhizobium]|uniref:DUF2971 domain-containing protein n=1 Tax=Rhizobium TaxID=379 RepID=UPI0013F3EEBF|nr:DUF2971 domain-containing protein [Rhizobium leguminosarum]UFW81013.1 DUF2971 domain-containing protein [Rhizobium leguminosarum bv. viciae]